MRTEGSVVKLKQEFVGNVSAGFGISNLFLLRKTSEKCITKMNGLKIFKNLLQYDQILERPPVFLGSVV